MKSNFSQRPPVILDLGNGSFYYNTNITPKTETGEDGQERTSYDCVSVQVWGSPNRADIVKAMIRAELDETAEFDLVNSYNAANEGIIDGDEAEQAKADYKAYLRRVQEIKAQVILDLAAAGY